NLGNVAQEQGDYTTARALFEECLTSFTELGDRRGIAHSLNGLGSVAQEQGDYTTARALFEECLTSFTELGDRQGIASSLEGLAAADAARDGTRGAAHLWAAAERLREEIGSPLPLNERHRY